MNMPVGEPALNGRVSAICRMLARDEYVDAVAALAVLERELHLAGDARGGEVGAAREAVASGGPDVALGILERCFDVDLSESPPAGAPRSGSAATVMASYAREHYRLVRDRSTGEHYAIPDVGGDAISFAAFAGVLEAHFLEQTGRVPTAGAASRVVELLRRGDAPVAEVVPTPTSDPEVSAEERARLQDDLATAAGALLTAPDVLAKLRVELRRDGFAGSTDVPELVFLAVNTTLLDIGRDGFAERLASIKVDGPSSSGKNYAVDAALDYLPSDVVVRITGQSAKALIYGTESLAHKFLYFPEGAGIRDDSDAAIFLRSLISEGELRYQVAVAQEDGPPVTQTIVRSGPTGALVTTSAVRLDNDLENRLTQATIDDSQELTRKIIAVHGARAARGSASRRDRSNWHARYHWLKHQAPINVRIPFAAAVAQRIPATAVRLRRDVSTLFALTAAHAALHLPTRDRNEDGYLIATEADYEAARRLTDTLLGANVGELTPDWAHETWEATPAGPSETITFAALGRKLGIGTDAARDRALKLINTGQLQNLETRPRHPARLIRGEPIRNDSGSFLPRYADLDIESEAGNLTRSPEHPVKTHADAQADERVVSPGRHPEPDPQVRAFGRTADPAPVPRVMHRHTTTDRGSGDRVNTATPSTPTVLELAEELAPEACNEHGNAAPWLARDGRHRCPICEPPHWPGEVVTTAEKRP